MPIGLVDAPTAVDDPDEPYGFASRVCYHLDRVGFLLTDPEHFVSTGHSASFTCSTWPQRIMARTTAVNRACVFVVRVIDNGQRPLRVFLHPNVNQRTGAGDSLILCADRVAEESQSASGYPNSHRVS